VDFRDPIEMLTGANDVKDTESRDQVRDHFHHIGQVFATGNSNAPILVHGTDVP
jgi:hypothetical protein